MQRHYRHIILILFSCILCYACSSTRTVPEGDRLYTGATIKWKDKKPKDYSALSDGMNNILRPKPNKKFLGAPFRLWLYNLGKEPKGKGLNYLLRKKWGEAPVLFSTVKTQVNMDLLTNYLEDNGYFQNEWTSGSKLSGQKKASVLYTVTPYTRSYIKSITFEAVTTQLSRTFARTNSKRSPYINVGAPYS